MAALTSELELLGLFKETSTVNKHVLLILQFWYQCNKYKGFESFKICTPCANKYAWEKEEDKNMTIFTEIIATMSDYLLPWFYS